MPGANANGWNNTDVGVSFSSGGCAFRNGHEFTNDNVDYGRRESVCSGTCIDKAGM